MMITKMKMPKMTKMKITKKKNMLIVSVCLFFYFYYCVCVFNVVGVFFVLFVGVHMLVLNFDVHVWSS